MLSSKNEYPCLHSFFHYTCIYSCKGAIQTTYCPKNEKLLTHVLQASSVLPNRVDTVASSRHGEMMKWDKYSANKLMSKVEAILIPRKTVHISGSKNRSSLEDMCLSSALISSSTRSRESFPCGLVNWNVGNVLLVYQNSENSVFLLLLLVGTRSELPCLIYNHP